MKGVDNPERFLDAKVNNTGAGVNENRVNEVNNPDEALKAGVKVENNIQANEEIPQVVDKNTTPIEQPVQNQQQANEPTHETDSFNKFIGQLDENTLQIESAEKLQIFLADSVERCQTSPHHHILAKVNANNQTIGVITIWVSHTCLLCMGNL